jgi:hypothetical protein
MPEPGNLRALVSLYRSTDVAWWFSRAGWDVSAMPGGDYLARRGTDEFVVRTLRRSGRVVQVWGVTADGAAAWAELCRMLGDVAGHYRAWWWDAAGGVARGETIGETMAFGPELRHVAPDSWTPRQLDRGSR